MYGALVTKWGETPQYVELDDPTRPDSDDEVQVKVSAVCLHNLVRARVKGIHYSVKGLPHIPGVDGVGTTPDGPVYFITYFSGNGSFVGRVNVARQDTFSLPPTLDVFQAAAFVNPAMSSWMALRRRARALPHNFTVLVLGATSASGEIAIHLSRHLGAGKVVGCARSPDGLGKLDLDERIILKTPATETDFSLLGPVDVILDYVYGPFTSHLLQSLNPSHSCQYIQIGSMADPRVTLDGSILRSKNIIIMGSGIGSFTEVELRAELPDLLEAMAPLDLDHVAVSPMSDVETQWQRQGTERMVFSL
ncbi:hypothetical protein HZ326_25036 [Fusarium oxysporum f. sp. albedinis]|nr:Uncharacterized protein HZ326_25391 [Fusarium oxysporum f. sp. albedinis]KAJ0131873.1 hypothetical protein HZ326_25036 [Fusarium oxysporum f. sp. albedinis]